MAGTALQQAPDDIGTAPAVERRRLRDQSPRMRWSLTGRAGLLIGLFCIACGAIPILGVSGVISGVAMSSGAPPLLGFMGGLVFVVPGVLFVLHGAGGLLDERRAARLEGRYPGEPWRFDHRWSAHGASTWVGGGLLGHVVMVGLAGPLTVGLAEWAAAPKGPWPIWIGAGVTGIMTVCGTSVIIKRIVQRVRFGRAHLRFETFPFQRGELLAAAFRCRQLRRFDRLTVTLRTIEEVVERRATDEGTSEQVVCDEIYADTWTIDDAGRLPDGAAELPITFDVPAEAAATKLAARPPTYWQIHVVAAGAGPEFDARFLVPVY